MLSAKQDENRLESSVSKVSSPGGASGGKVVTSIQGLQQRLNDYTLEEVSAAENMSRTLMVGLLNLQSRVGSLVTIKRAMTVVYEALQTTTSEDIKLSVVETSGKPIKLHDIIQASNLIKFPTLKRTSHQSPGHIISNVTASERLAGGNHRAKSTTDVVRKSSAADHREAADCPNEPAFVFGATPIEASSGIPSADFSWDKDPESNTNISDHIQYEQELQTIPLRSAPEKLNNPESETSAPEFVQELPLAEELEKPITTALVPTGGDFDQRLLDDLIKNYGEFFSSANSPSKVVPQVNVETFEPRSKPIFLEKPAVESAKNNTARPSPLKKEGDIDRELKKIIKDYGEYDIYSRRHNRINLKFAAIGAFLLVVAVFSGFYLLSSSKSQERSSPPAAAEPVSGTSDEHTSAMRELKQPTKASETKTPSKSPIVKK